MSIVKVIQPWIKQYLVDNLLLPTVQLIKDQLIVHKEIDIDMVTVFHNQKTFRVLKQLSLELNDYFPVDSLFSPSELRDIKRKRKELSRLRRQLLKNSDNSAIAGSDSCSKVDITIEKPEKRLPNLSELLPLQCPDSTICENVEALTVAVEKTSCQPTLQVKPLHELIDNTNSIYPSTSNEFMAVSVTGSSSLEKKKKKKKKSKEPVLATEASINNVSHDLYVDSSSVTDTVINRSTTQVPESVETTKTDSWNNPSFIKEIILKLVSLMESPSDEKKKEIKKDIFCAFGICDEESSSTKKRKKKKDKQAKRQASFQDIEVIDLIDSAEVPLDDIVYEDASSKIKKKKRKHRDSFDQLEVHTNHKRKNHKERVDELHRNQDEDCTMVTEQGVELNSEQYTIAENECVSTGRHKKNKNKKSKQKEMTAEEASEHLHVPEGNEILGSVCFSDKRHRLSSNLDEGGKTVNEKITPTRKSPSNRTSHNSTLYDFEHLIPETVISQTRNTSFDTGRENDSLECSSNGRLMPESDRAPRSDDQATTNQCSNLNQLNNVVRRYEPSCAVYNPDSDSSSVEMLFHSTGREATVKVEPMSPSSQNYPVDPLEPTPVKENPRKSSSNPKPNCVPSEILSMSVTDTKDDILHEVVDIINSGINRLQPEVVDNSNSQALKEGGNQLGANQERPEVVIPSSERFEATSFVPEPVPSTSSEIVIDNNAVSGQQDQYRSLEKELLELEQCLYYADKKNEPSNGDKAKSAVSRESVDITNPSCLSFGSAPNPGTNEKPQETSVNNNGTENGSIAGKELEKKFECHKCGQTFSLRHKLYQHWIEHVKENIFEINVSETEANKNGSKSSKSNRNLPDICPDPPVNKKPMQNHTSPNPCNISTALAADTQEIHKKQTVGSPQTQMQTKVDSCKSQPKSATNPNTARSPLKANSCKTQPKSATNPNPAKSLLKVNSCKTQPKSATNPNPAKSLLKVNSCKTQPKSAINPNTGKSPLKCDVCMSAFKTVTGLSKHMKKHAKPFKCSLCNASFQSDKALKHHLIKHSNKKPFKCPKCSTGFKRKGDMNVHLAKFHHVARFTCELCKIRFRFRQSFLAHRKEVHSVVPPSKNQ